MTAHNARGLPLALVDANGVTTDLAYDPRGRLVGRTVDPGPEQAVTSFVYDDVGQVTQVTLPDGSQLDYVYDAARRLTEVTPWTPSATAPRRRSSPRPARSSAHAAGSTTSWGACCASSAPTCSRPTTPTTWRTT
jgi:YD repeat-containing protein